MFSKGPGQPSGRGHVEQQSSGVRSQGLAARDATARITACVAGVGLGPVLWAPFACTLTCHAICYMVDPMQVDFEKDVVLGARIGQGAMGSVHEGTFRGRKVGADAGMAIIYVCMHPACEGSSKAARMQLIGADGIRAGVACTELPRGHPCTNLHTLPLQVAIKLFPSEVIPEEVKAFEQELKVLSRAQVAAGCWRALGLLAWPAPKCVVGADALQQGSRHGLARNLVRSACMLVCTGPGL